LEVRNFFHDPNASRVNAGNAFLVMQANLYVTQVRSFWPDFTLTSLKPILMGISLVMLLLSQQLVRFVIEQYRDELVAMIRTQTDPGVDTSDLTRGWTSTDDREAVASDLLMILHSIPIQAIATNGYVVRNVRNGLELWSSGVYGVVPSL
jgi:hypothetical protein